MSKYPPGHFTWEGTFDFFHYAGILRSVSLLSRPKVFLTDYKIDTDFHGIIP